MKVGDLIKWTDYTAEPPVAYYAIYLRKKQLSMTFANIIVLYQGVECDWISWQCEVVSEV